MKPLVIVAVLVVLSSGVWFITRSSETIQNYPPKNEKIVAFGDSLVFGQGATEGNDFVTLLGKSIGRNIMNYGVRGNTTADGVARMHEVIKENPGLVILLLGGNDTLRRIPIETTESNLRMLVDTFQKNGAVVVLIGVRGGILGSAREDMYERVAHEYGALYVPDILDGILLKPELMSDAIHPNDAGYARIAERLTDIFDSNKLRN